MLKVVFILYLLRFAFLIGGVCATKCDFNTRCRCYFISQTSLYRADCSKLELKYIPIFPNNIQQIDFSNNLIERIPDANFENNSALQNLSLAHNMLQDLNKESFNGLTNVINLKLNNNNITRINDDSFLFLRKLSFLDLKNNNIMNISNIDFTMLPFLHTLRVDLIGNEEVVFPKGLMNLKNLDISGISGKCDVKRLTKETFWFVPTLEDLNLSACKINYIYKGTFRFMSNLAILDVSFNTCLKFSGMENVTCDLPYTSIRILKCNKIHKTFELNTELKISHLKCLRNTNLTEIEADSNRIQLVERGAIPMLPYTIRNISMSDNEFSFGTYLTEFAILPVQFVNLSFLFKSHDPSNYNHEEECDRPDYEHCHQICRKRNSLNKGIPLQSYGFRLFPIPYRLKTLIYRQCQLRYEIPPLKISDNTLEYIDGSFNTFYSWIGPLLCFKHVRHLNLSNNLCSNVSNVFFQSVPNLQFLYAQNNLLGIVLPDDVNGKILQANPKLEEINLANNRIPSLPFKFFESQIMLKRLFIGGNMLDDITFKISHMNQLLHLDLSSNRISSLDQKARNQLDVLFRKNRNLTIDLSGNPLKCACDTIKFIKWMTTTEIRLHNLKNYNCKFSNEDKETFKNPVRVYEILQKECSSYTTLIIGTLAIILLFLFILSAGLVYRHRWKLRYLYYMTKNRYQGKRRASPHRDEKSYEYDAFISYEDKDRLFVHEKLLNELEHEGGLKLCLHQRDFLPGNDIAANITSAIHDSRKMVVVMSRNYLDSHWCMFEYNMARVESIYSRNKENILFLVFLEQISSKDLPLIVLELVQSQSYIEYPDDEYGDTVFWEKLKDVLSQY